MTKKDTTPVSSRTFDDGDWHIKFAAAGDKKIAWDLKERLNLPIGEVVGRALRHWAGGERRQAEGPHQPVVLAAASSAAPCAALADAAALPLPDLLLALQIAQELAALRGGAAKDVVEARFVRGVRLQLARRLGVLNAREMKRLVAAPEGAARPAPGDKRRD